MTFWQFIAAFFTDGKESPSMSRLLCFLSFFPATYELIRINSENAMGWYLGAYVLGYVGGKLSEGRGNPNNGGQ